MTGRFRWHRNAAAAARQDEHAWDIATNIPVAPAPVGVDVTGAAATAPPHYGVVVARPHATGWFVSARFRHGLHRRHVEQFKRFVTLRVYLLLHEGPAADIWQRGHAADEWRSYAVPDAIGNVMGIPETVPAEWL